MKYIKIKVNDSLYEMAKPDHSGNLDELTNNILVQFLEEVLTEKTCNFNDIEDISGINEEFLGELKQDIKGFLDI